MPTETLQQETSGNQNAQDVIDASGLYQINTDNLKLGNVIPFIVGSPDRWYIILRFEIPFDLTDREITQATLKLKGFYFSDAPLDVTVNTYCHDTDDASIPADRTAALAVIASGLTTAFAEYFLTGSIFLDVVYDFDVTDALIEVMSRGGFTSGNGVCLYLITTEPNPPTADDTAYFFATDDDPPAIAESRWPVLEIEYEYTTPGSGGGDRHVEHELDVIQFFTAQNFSQPIYHDLTIEEDILYSVEFGREIVDDLTIEQDVHIVGDKNIELEQFLNITQLIEAHREYDKTVEHFIDIDVTLVQDILRNAPKDKQIVDELEIIQDIDGERIFNRTIIDVLEVIDEIHVTPMQIFYIEDGLLVEQFIEVTGTFASPHAFEDELVIEQDIVLNRIVIRAFEDELNVIQFFFAFRQGEIGVGGGPGGSAGGIDDGPVDAGTPGNSYVSPDVWAPIFDTSTPLPPEPVMVDASDMILEYPFDTPTEEVVLKRPLFSNREELQVTRAQQRSIDGDLITFTDADWPRVITNRYKFAGITDEIRDAFYTFLMLTIGFEIKLTDYEGQVWKGFIVTPQGETVDQSDLTECENTLEFDFIGVRQ